MNHAPCVIADNTLTLRCHIQPGARKSQFCGLYNQRIKIQLQAPPVDGKANSALIAYLAQAFELPKRSITITSGLKQRQKTVTLSGISEMPEVLQKLLDE